MTDARPLSGLLRNVDDVVDALRARKDELALSNESLEELAGFCGGTVNKYLGPAREKVPTWPTMELLFGALGVGVVLVVDEEAAERMQHRWTPRQDRVRDNGRVSKAAINRTRAAVLAEIGRKGAAARWARMSPAERHAHIELMNLGRAIKHL